LIKTIVKFDYWNKVVNKTQPEISDKTVEVCLTFCANNLCTFCKYGGIPCPLLEALKLLEQMEEEVGQ
jgi:hypothetical protein